MTEMSPRCHRDVNDRYGGTLGTPRGSQLAYAGAQGVFRDDDNSSG